MYWYTYVLYMGIINMTQQEDYIFTEIPLDPIQSP